MKKKKYLILLLFLSSPLFASEFIENRGQWDADVRYKTESAGMTAWIMPGSVIYDYSKMEVNGRDTSLAGHVIKCSLAGTSAVPEFAPSGRNKIVRNYFTGNDPTKWAKHVASFSSVTAKDIYPGTDIRYYFDATGMRYDFILHPGADPENIMMKFTGQDYIDIDAEGSLVLGTSLGEIKHGQIFAYQESGKPGDSRLSAVPCRFILNSDGSVGLSPGNYDPDLPLVIDPLVYSSYFGGDIGDSFEKFAALGDTNYVAGYTYSRKLPYTEGAYSSRIWGNMGVIVARLNKNNHVNLLAYIGGFEKDRLKSFKTYNGKLYIAGETSSNNFPVTEGVIKDGPTNDEGTINVFVSCFNSTLDSLLMSSYFGVFDREYCHWMDVYDDGIIIAGKHGSTKFPECDLDKTTLIVGNEFICKFDHGMKTLLSAARVGGDGSGLFEIKDGFRKSNGNLVFAGNTYCTGLPLTVNARDTIANDTGFADSKHTDIFFMEISSDFKNLEYLSYFGGTLMDSVAKLLYIDDNNFYLGGYTRSKDLPNMKGNIIDDGPDSDYMLVRFDGNYDNEFTAIYGTNDGDDYGVFIDSDPSGYIYMGGYSSGRELEVSEDAIMKEKQPPFDEYMNFDATFMKVDPSGDTLLYSTFIGGSGRVSARSVYCDNYKVYVGGFTKASDFYLSEDAQIDSLSCTQNAFITVFDFTDPNVIIEEMPQSQNISTYPNPFRDRFTFVLENNSETEIQAVLYNIQGIETARTTYTNLTPGTFSLPFKVPEIPSGAYVLKISSGGKIVSTCKVMKE